MLFVFHTHSLVALSLPLSLSLSLHQQPEDVPLIMSILSLQYQHSAVALVLWS